MPVPAPPRSPSATMTEPAQDAGVLSMPPLPTTPVDGAGAAANSDAPLKPSLSRKSSRPSQLQIAQFSADIQVDQNSPQNAGERVSEGLPAANVQKPTMSKLVADVTISSPVGSSSNSSDSPRSIPNPIHSPCFVHSNLDKNASLSDWLNHPSNGIFSGLGVSKSLQSPLIEYTKPQRIHKLDDADTYAEEDIKEEETSASLTKQLAETAVGVREMSKQLGRARIKSNIQSVLIVTKARDNRLIKLTRDLALYLMLRKRQGERGLVVYVDHQLRTSRRFDAAGIERDHPELFNPIPRRRSSSNNSQSSSSTLLSMSSSQDSISGNGIHHEGQLRYWTSEMCSRSPHLFDFVVTLGGDGTVLFTSWLFQRIVPPVLPFALGSLGFLTNFDFSDHQSVMDSVIDNGIRVNLRMRFTCTVFRADRGPEGRSKRKAVKKGDTGEIMMRNIEKGGWEALEGGGTHEHRSVAKDKEIMCFTTRPAECFEVINDLVIDRGPSPYVSMLELFGDEHHMTTVQGDGLTISTPTGSTAYSLSAGGSLVHPEIPAILITPIAPHTLSFRPMLLPDSMEVRVCVPFNSRSTAWVSFDGRGRVELKQGDHIKVTASKYPFPTVCHDKQSTDWFHAISRTLKWNDRERQKSFVVVEEGPEKKKSSKAAINGSDEHKPTDRENADESEDEDEQEDNFDIDDLSSNDTQEAESTTKQLGDSIKQPLPSDSMNAQRAAEALLGEHVTHGGHPRSGIHSGVDSPNRFIAGSPPHPPHPLYQQSHPIRVQRHVQFAHASAPGHAHHPHRDDARTPTASEHRRHRAQARHITEPSSVSPRAFACYGQDESDSAPSDSDL